MVGTGGSILEVSLGGRIFPVAADAESNRKLGGCENELEMNGDGSARIVKTRVPLQLDGLTLEVDDARGDQEFLQGLADASDFFTFSATFANGTTYQGTAQIIGEFQCNSKNATAQVTLAGPGNMTKQ
jgi:hypothetical protein